MGGSRGQEEAVQAGDAEHGGWTPSLEAAVRRIFQDFIRAKVARLRSVCHPVSSPPADRDDQPGAGVDDHLATDRASDPVR